jgi:hypothetical protein
VKSLSALVAAKSCNDPLGGSTAFERLAALLASVERVTAGYVLSELNTHRVYEIVRFKRERRSAVGFARDELYVKGHYVSAPHRNRMFLLEGAPQAFEGVSHAFDFSAPETQRLLRASVATPPEQAPTRCKLGAGGRVSELHEIQVQIVMNI